MKIIDAHMHFSNIESFRHTAGHISMLDYSRAGFDAECRKNNVVSAVCMGLTETGKNAFPDDSSETPMLADLCDSVPGGVYVCPGVNPHRLSAGNIEALEAECKKDRCVGIKIYAGYYHVDIYDKIYLPVYEMASRYGLPVVVHTGFTYSERGLLAYSHPLNVDRLAVMYRDVDFVMAHIGDPWVLDACGVAHKNPNAYLDLSGLIVGDAAEFATVTGSELMMDRYKVGLVMLNDYSKVLYGSDWPLASMEDYIGFCKKLTPRRFFEDVFYNNAKRVFKKII